MNRLPHRHHRLTAVCLGAAYFWIHLSTAAPLANSPVDARWESAVLAAQSRLEPLAREDAAFAKAAAEFSVRMEREFPVEWDWCLQDAGPDPRPWLSSRTLPDVVRRALDQVLAELGDRDAGLRDRVTALAVDREGTSPRRWLETYHSAGELRRQARLRHLRERYPKWVFAKHYTLGGSHYAYTEGQSDAQNERHFRPGTALCVLELDTARSRVRSLLEDPNGVIRDPDVSWDGRRVLFAWKKSDREDDYHLYEMELADGSMRSVTQGLGFADYEGVYLPNGDLLFNSTRCVQTVDCWWTEVSNLYTCAPDGRYLRRLTFDQVHDNGPSVMPDGRVLYTRWEYSDRGQLFVQGLFQMNPDGTGQTEFYGNNSWFPTSLLHARGIPGSRKVVAIFSGHHTLQVGKLGLLDPARGRQESSGTQLIAPRRETPAVRVDVYGQEGELFQYPYPLSESEFVVAAAPLGWGRSPTLFKVYWIAADGRRELLAADPDISCSQAVPWAARTPPPRRPQAVDYRETTSTCYLHDVYAGPGLSGVARGTIKALRVVALGYRAAGVGCNYNAGPAGEALVCTPVAVGNGSWDVKTVLGEATVHEDGSAFFTLPARTPVYFQAVDRRGFVAQTMRSWTTLQPGENAACIGCHESKNSAPPTGTALSEAMQAGPQALREFHGPPRGFSFAREIQPILDRHCVRCHDDTRKWEERLPGIRLSPALLPDPVAKGATNETAFSLLGTPVVEDLAKRRWSASYLALVQATPRTLGGNRYLAGTTNALVNWISAQSVPDLLPPYVAGSACSSLLSMVDAGHRDVRLSRAEVETIACWMDLLVPFCGDYEEAHQWTEEESGTYRHFLEKRRQMETVERQNINDWIETQAEPAAP